MGDDHISTGVAISVVDFLEVIDVEMAQRHEIQLTAFCKAGTYRVEAAAVEKSGQVVVVSSIARFGAALVCGFPLFRQLMASHHIVGDIPFRADEAWLAIPVDEELCA